MYKFKQNDIISNTVVANPRYKFSFFNGKAYINDQVDNGLYTTALLNQTGTIQLNDLNIIYDNKHTLFTSLDKSYNKSGYSPITGEARISFEMKRDFIKKSSVGGYEPEYTTGFGSPATSSIAKFLSLKNSINYRRERSGVYNFNSYFTETLDLKADTVNGDLLQDINILSVDNIFYGSMIKPGTVNLEFYKSGSLLAKAQDTKKNGELIEQTNSTLGAGTVVGFALYEEGIVILTNTSSLGSGQEYYQQPTSSAGVAILDNPKWTHFGSYINVSGAVGSAITGSSYVVDFQGTVPKPTLTMFAHAPKNDLNWSNNPTYLDASTKANYINNTSSQYYEESNKVQVKNIVSSSFSNYSASFEPTTYIRTVGVYDKDKNLIAVAKVANPVKKTIEQDYTFKLKLDL
jgi:hypothetical protein